jgi:hypothetical protein
VRPIGPSVVTMVTPVTAAPMAWMKLDMSDASAPCARQRPVGPR